MVEKELRAAVESSPQSGRLPAVAGGCGWGPVRQYGGLRIFPRRPLPETGDPGVGSGDGVRVP
jgi:hypothetical protein